MPDSEPTVSIVIPCYNDAEQLEECLRAISTFSCESEVIVVDASPENSGLRDVTRQYGFVYIETGIASRGAQLNKGARVATGNVLLFHHADTVITEAHVESMTQTLHDDPELKCGAFYKDIRAHYPRLVWAERVVRFYSRRIGVLYGDQSCFFRRAHFEEVLNGYKEIPLMEDVEMSSRMRKAGGLTLIDPPIRTSMRKFRKEGLVWRKVQNVALVLLFRLGVSPERLYRWYYRNRCGS